MKECVTMEFFSGKRKEHIKILLILELKLLERNKLIFFSVIYCKRGSFMVQFSSVKYLLHNFFCMNFRTMKKKNDEKLYTLYSKERKT